MKKQDPTPVFGSKQTTPPPVTPTTGSDESVRDTAQSADRSIWSDTVSAAGSEDGSLTPAATTEIPRPRHIPTDIKAEAYDYNAETAKDGK